MGGQGVRSIPYLELGGAEELGVGLGRQDASHPQHLLSGFLADEVRQM